ncbi:MAG: hypothetical protein LBE14_01825 [Treponema sp.]|jgi:hypothetical protein|nr:hypothetical protein [Treponema sp.]
MLNPKGFRIIPLLLLCGAALLMGFGAQEPDNNEGPGTAEPRPPLYRDRNKTAQAKPERKKNQAETKAPETVRVSGRVRLVGNSQRMSLVITGEEGEWYTEPKDRDKLMALQQRTVTVEGTLHVQEISLLGGKYTGRRFILRDITVISSE